VQQIDDIFDDCVNGIKFLAHSLMQTHKMTADNSCDQ